MADLRVSYPVLEDSSTQAGLPIHKVLQGDALANKNAVPTLAFKDAAGNLRYPKVNASDELVVSMDSAEVASLSDEGSAVAGSTSAYQDVATIALQADMVYRKIEYIAGCFRDAQFRIVHNDNGTPVVLASGILVGSGKYTDSQTLNQLTFTAGSTGTQELKLQAKNLTVVSDLSGTLSAEEVQ